MPYQHTLQPSPLPGPNCERCGRCLAVCPSYRTFRVETLSPRGRFEVLAGLADHSLEASPRTALSLGSCLQCQACAAICGKGVDVAGLVRGFRADKPVSALGRTLAAVGFGLVLAHRPLLAAAAWGLRLIGPVLPKRGEPPVRHLPLALPQALRGRAVPQPAGWSLFDRYPERVPARPGVTPRGTAALFAGCWHAVLEPGPAAAAVDLLTAAGFEVLIPREQTCCGFAALSSGYADHAGRLAERNRRVLAGLPRGTEVFAPCPSCRTGLSLTGALDRPARDPVSFLAEVLTPGPAPEFQGVRVAVHEPCHARGTAQATTALLGRIPGVEAVALDEAACCGGGGLSSLSNPELAWSLGQARVQDIAASGAALAAAACPGCLLQLRGCLARSDIPVRCVHPLELLAATLPRG